MDNKRVFIPQNSVVSADLLLVNYSVNDDLGLDPEHTNRSFVGQEMLRKFRKDQQES